jgi:hypothetical protein
MSRVSGCDAQLLREALLAVRARRGGGPMLSLPLPVNIFWCLVSTDIRKSFGGPAVIVAEQLQHDPLSVIKTAIAAAHAGNVRREELSGYYLTAIVASDYGGMLIALPPAEWTTRYAALSPQELPT